MGDALHKKSPPEGEEDVTVAFVRDARAMLKLNKDSNRLADRKRGDHGWLIQSQGELEETIEASKGVIRQLLGDAKADPGLVARINGRVCVDKVPVTARSAYVAPIRKALALSPLVSIRVPSDRAGTLLKIAELTPDRFARFRDRVEKNET